MLYVIFFIFKFNFGMWGAIDSSEIKTKELKMANKNLFKSLVGKLVSQTDSFNEAGGKAYKLTPEQALAQFAVTGTFNNTFYANAEDQLSKVYGFVNSVDAEFVAKLALYSRSQAHMKDMPAYLLAVLSVKDGELFEKIFDRVVSNGKMLRNFVQIMRSGATGRKSLGSRPKRLVKSWLCNRNDRALFADSVGNDPSLADIVKMVHPKPDSDSRKAFYAYLIGKEHDFDALPEIVKAYELFKNGKGGMPDVPFQMLTSLSLTDSDWKEIAKNAPWHMTRMNLNTFARHGVFKDHALVDLIAARLSAKRLVEKAKVFPYQLMVAWKNASADVPAKVTDALHTAMEHAVANVPAFKGKVFICVDVSGSMSCPVTGYRSGSTSKVRCIDVAALMAASILRNNSDAEILPFDTAVVNLRLNRFDSVMTNAEKLASVGGGGTNCSAPLKKLNDSGREGDLIIMVSDNESWADRPWNRGTGLMNEWAKFKARNSRSRLVCLDIQPYDTSQAKDNQDVLNVGGFSDQVFKVIEAFNRDGLQGQAFLNEIEKMEL